MAIFSLIVGVIIAVLSLLFWIGKVPKQILDFDKISKEENGTLRQKELGRNIGAVLLLLAIIFLLAGIFPIFKEKYLVPFFIGWVVIVVADTYFIQKSNRYRNRKK